MLKVIPRLQLTQALLEFKCTKDEDIQEFLRTKSLEYEKRGWCSTYILVNEEKLKHEGIIFIVGYFTLSNKVIRLSDSISQTRRKRLYNGLKKMDNHMHFILIGQLGKYIDEKGLCGEISALEMLNRAFEVIYQVKERITCNCVLIECKEEPKIRKIYEDYGFKELQQADGLIQYFKII